MTARRHDLPQALVAVLWGAGAAVVAAAALARQEAGEHVSPWVWVGQGFCAVISVMTYEWDLVWRTLHP